MSHVVHRIQAAVQPPTEMTTVVSSANFTNALDRRMDLKRSMRSLGNAHFFFSPPFATNLRAMTVAFAAPAPAAPASAAAAAAPEPVAAPHASGLDSWTPALVASVLTLLKAAPPAYASAVKAFDALPDVDTLAFRPADELNKHPIGKFGTIFVLRVRLASERPFACWGRAILPELGVDAKQSPSAVGVRELWMDTVMLLPESIVVVLCPPTTIGISLVNDARVDGFALDSNTEIPSPVASHVMSIDVSFSADTDPVATSSSRVPSADRERAAGAQFDNPGALDIAVAGTASGRKESFPSKEFCNWWPSQNGYDHAIVNEFKGASVARWSSTANGHRNDFLWGVFGVSHSELDKLLSTIYHQLSRSGSVAAFCSASSRLMSQDVTWIEQLSNSTKTITNGLTPMAALCVVPSILFGTPIGDSAKKLVNFFSVSDKSLDLMSKEFSETICKQLQLRPTLRGGEPYVLTNGLVVCSRTLTQRAEYKLGDLGLAARYASALFVSRLLSVYWVARHLTDSTGKHNAAEVAQEVFALYEVNYRTNHVMRVVNPHDSSLVNFQASSVVDLFSGGLLKDCDLRGPFVKDLGDEDTKAVDAIACLQLRMHFQFFLLQLTIIALNCDQASEPDNRIKEAMTPLFIADTFTDDAKQAPSHPSFAVFGVSALFVSHFVSVLYNGRRSDVVIALEKMISTSKRLDILTQACNDYVNAKRGRKEEKARKTAKRQDKKTVKGKRAPKKPKLIDDDAESDGDEEEDESGNGSDDGDDDEDEDGDDDNDEVDEDDGQDAEEEEEAPRVHKKPSKQQTKQSSPPRSTSSRKRRRIMDDDDEATDNSESSPSVRKPRPPQPIVAVAKKRLLSSSREFHEAAKQALSKPTASVSSSSTASSIAAAAATTVFVQDRRQVTSALKKPTRQFVAETESYSDGDVNEI